MSDARRAIPADLASSSLLAGLSHSTLDKLCVAFELRGLSAATKPAKAERLLALMAVTVNDVQRLDARAGAEALTARRGGHGGGKAARENGWRKQVEVLPPPPPPLPPHSAHLDPRPTRATGIHRARWRDRVRVMRRAAGRGGRGWGSHFHTTLLCFVWRRITDVMIVYMGAWE